MSEQSAPAQITSAEAAREILRALEGGDAVVAITIIETPARPGTRMLVWKDRIAGTLGPSDLDEAAVDLARAVLAVGTPATHEVTGQSGTRTLYMEPFSAPPELIIVGAGHIARPLCTLGAMLGFRVVILDDRPDFATRERFPEATEVVHADFSAPLRGIDLTRTTYLVLVTRGHKYDFDALRDVLLREDQPAYIGMVGSRRRVRAACEVLAGDGISTERLATVHAPIGLDIGAETPEEIAVAIVAEIVRLRRGGTGESLRDRERVVERWVGR